MYKIKSKYQILCIFDILMQKHACVMYYVKMIQLNLRRRWYHPSEQETTARAGVDFPFSRCKGF